MAKPKKQVFSVTKAVKANARERLGTPPQSSLCPTPRPKPPPNPNTKKLSPIS